jgi:fused signal recognition particle receptor
MALVNHYYCKLAYQFKKKQGYNVVLGAADTLEPQQLINQVWADRVGVPIVRQIWVLILLLLPSLLQSAVAQNSDIVIIDSRRLHNKINLMNELTCKACDAKSCCRGPHDVLLVLDGSYRPKRI